ncbi:unnamed protein product [Pedinophyceae sp. YPF-701]|nr:unnamed protein product [Pedinophyceae sp. YPF-701]
MLEATLSRALEATLRVCAVVRDHRQLQEAAPWLLSRITRARAVLCRVMGAQARLRDPEAIEARLRTELLPALEELERAVPKQSDRAAACSASGAWQSRVKKLTDVLVSITGHSSLDTEPLDRDDNASTQQHAAIQRKDAATDPAPFASAEYDCGICLRSVRDPVMLLDSGHTYCRACIEMWVSGRLAANHEPTDPRTGMRLNLPVRSVENWALKSVLGPEVELSGEAERVPFTINTVAKLRAAIDAGFRKVIDLEGRTLKGSGDDAVVLPHPGVTLRNGKLAGVKLVIKPTAKNTRLAGLTVSGSNGGPSGTGARNAVIVEAARGVKIVGCTLNGAKRGLAVLDGAQVPAPVHPAHRCAVVAAPGEPLARKITSSVRTVVCR